MQVIPTEEQRSVTHPQQSRRRFTRRNLLLGAAVSAAGLALYSNEISRHEIDITHRTFRIRRLAPAFAGFRIVQISDIHLDEFTEDFFLNQIIRRVNALAPDLVLITGDFCSRGPLPVRFGLADAQRCAEMLRGIACPQRFAVLGNHDAVVGPVQIRGFLERNGTPVLVNQYLPIERAGERFWLAGLDDCLSGHPDLNLTIPTQREAEAGPILLMGHEPDYVQNVIASPRGALVDLVFSGHTHGGQVRLPGIKPLLLPPMGEHFPEGHYFLGNLQLYVNRGVGTVGVPFRLNCPPEITVATLQPALA
jgi:predicted MPP superfamily phosphohydrolase